MKIRNLKKKVLINCKDNWMRIIGLTLIYGVLLCLSTYLIDKLFIFFSESISKCLLYYLILGILIAPILGLFYTKYLINLRNSKRKVRYKDVKLTLSMIFNNMKYIFLLLILSIVPVIIIIVFSIIYIFVSRGGLYYCAITYRMSINTLRSVVLVIGLLALISLIFIIWLRLTYAFTIYIIAENIEENKTLTSMKEARRLIQGYKWKLILLKLSFIGWSILSILSLGIGYLWLIPYINLTTIEFFYGLRDIKDK